MLVVNLNLAVAAASRRMRPSSTPFRHCRWQSIWKPYASTPAACCACSSGL